MILPVLIPDFQVELVDSDDARWLASHYPEAFTLVSDLRAIVRVRDLGAALELRGRVELGSDDDGPLLWVRGMPYEMLAV